jgi:hypothetical protein
VSALPHLMHRLKRRLGLQMLRARAVQLEQLVTQTEESIVAAHDDLALMRNEQQQICNRLRFANAHPNYSEKPACN